MSLWQAAAVALAFAVGAVYGWACAASRSDDRHAAEMEAERRRTEHFRRVAVREARARILAEQVAGIGEMTTPPAKESP
jgi:hypothetical protein